jgi:hypothetical protein
MLQGGSFVVVAKAHSLANNLGFWADETQLLWTFANGS